MFAIAFDLDTAATAQNHPKSLSRAYTDVAHTLRGHGFDWVQGSLYVNAGDDLVHLFDAIAALKRLPWFPPSVRDIRAFKVEHWSDFTSAVKQP